MSCFLAVGVGVDAIAEEKVRVRLEMVESGPDFLADVWVKSPVDLIGFEMIFSSEPNTLSSVDFSLANMLNPIEKFPDMEYSFYFIRDIGGYDLGKFLAYEAAFSDNGRIEKEKWPACDYRRIARINFGPDWKWDNLPPVGFSFIFEAGNKTLEYLLENNLGTKTVQTPLKDYVDNLFQNYPNPFDVRGTRINYTLKNPSKVRLDVYNSNGEHLVTLVDEDQNEGEHAVNWKPNKGSGVFFYKIVTPEYSQIKKMALIK